MDCTDAINYLDSFKKIPITGIIADLDVAHVFNVTYVDCSLFVVLHLMLRPQGHKKWRSLSIHIRVMSLDGAALGKLVSSRWSHRLVSLRYANWYIIIRAGRRQQCYSRCSESSEHSSWNKIQRTSPGRYSSPNLEFWLPRSRNISPNCWILCRQLGGQRRSWRKLPKKRSRRAGNTASLTSMTISIGELTCHRSSANLRTSISPCSLPLIESVVLTLSRDLLLTACLVTDITWSWLVRIISSIHLQDRHSVISRIAVSDRWTGNSSSFERRWEAHHL